MRYRHTNKHTYIHTYPARKFVEVLKGGKSGYCTDTAGKEGNARHKELGSGKSRQDCQNECASAQDCLAYSFMSSRTLCHLFGPGIHKKLPSGWKAGPGTGGDSSDPARTVRVLSGRVCFQRYYGKLMGTSLLCIFLFFIVH